VPEFELMGVPCDSHEFHIGHIKHLSKATRHFNPAARHRPGSPTHLALSWLAQPQSSKRCRRLLLKIRELLRAAPPEFAERYREVYIEAYGRLLATLIETSTAIGASPATLWAEATGSFKTADGWAPKDRVLKTMCATITGLGTFEANEGFWDTLGTCTTYLDAAFGSTLGLDEAIVSAGRSYVDFLYLVLSRLTTSGSERIENNNNTVDATILAHALHLSLNIVVRLRDDIRNWASLACVTRNSIGYSGFDVESRLLQTSRELSAAAYSEPDAERRLEYMEALAVAIPSLQNRTVAGPRLKLPEEDARCAVETDCGVCEGRIINVCSSTQRGFAIEIRGLELVPPIPKDGGDAVSQDWPGSPSYSRRILARSLDTPSVTKAFDRIRLRARFQHTRDLEAPCAILRAWPLQSPKGGVGVAAFSNETPHHEWAAYLSALEKKQSPSPLGRYNPYDPHPVPQL